MSKQDLVELENNWSYFQDCKDAESNAMAKRMEAERDVVAQLIGMGAVHCFTLKPGAVRRMFQK